MSADPVARRAHTVIRSLLDGTPLPAAAPCADLGPWAETVQALLVAWDQEGQAGVQRAFVALARQEPALVALLANDEHSSLRTVWTVAELYAANFPPPRFVVPDLLPAGLTILAGRPKLGKSWLALQVAAAVGSGQAVLDQMADAGGVLYLALEDTPGRLKERALKQGIPAAAAITFYTAWAPLTQQGLVDLLLAAGQGYRLIIIDTLSRSMGRADPMDAVDMTLLLSSLQRLAARHDLALLLIDHHRKPAAGVGDAIDDILGSTAKAGVVDAAWGLYKQRGEQAAVLKVTGRDLCERELAVRWDEMRCIWQVQGEAQTVERTQRQQEVLDALTMLGTATLRDIAESTGQEKGNCFRRLQALVKDGTVVRKDGHGQVMYSVVA
ncbi:MAG: AAA family ATPase [Anaerolineales bacterium]|nr:AAA family ATPase [Anaerolineales bacterium]